VQDDAGSSPVPIANFKINFMNEYKKYDFEAMLDFSIENKMRALLDFLDTCPDPTIYQGLATKFTDELRCIKEANRKNLGSSDELIVEEAVKLYLQKQGEILIKCL
jgi:hypothetical protein